jgi:hypothetical protein
VVSMLVVGFTIIIGFVIWEWYVNEGYNLTSRSRFRHSQLAS